MKFLGKFWYKKHNSIDIYLLKVNYKYIRTTFYSTLLVPLLLTSHFYFPTNILVWYPERVIPGYETLLLVLPVQIQKLKH